MMMEDADFMMNMLKMMMPLEGKLTIADSEIPFRIFTTKIRGKEHIVIAIPTEEDDNEKTT